MNSVLIIPTINPTEKTIALITELKKRGINKIVIVDDGSDSQSSEIFKELEKENCKVIHHDHNLGKGKSLKDGIKYASENFSNILGYVTADSDGQHLPEDIKKVAKQIEINHKNIVLGERNLYNKKVPRRSRFGNKFSSIFYKMQTGIELEDTQTGLRGIPCEYTKMVLETDGDRYDYEMNFLINAAFNKIEFTKVPIATVYENKNKSSHFRTVQDSLLIYKNFIKFIAIAISSAVIDVGLFSILNSILSMQEHSRVIVATIIARFTSGIFNFSANSKWNFKSEEKIVTQAYKYCILFLIQMLVSSSLVSVFSILPINITIIKIMVDLGIFMTNYFIEKKFVFRKSSIKGDKKNRWKAQIQKMKMEKEY